MQTHLPQLPPRLKQPDCLVSWLGSASHCGNEGDAPCRPAPRCALFTLAAQGAPVCRVPCAGMTDEVWQEGLARFADPSIAASAPASRRRR